MERARRKQAIEAVLLSRDTPEQKRDALLQWSDQLVYQAPLKKLRARQQPLEQEEGCCGAATRKCFWQPLCQTLGLCGVTCRIGLLLAVIGGMMTLVLSAGVWLMVWWYQKPWQGWS